MSTRLASAATSPPREAYGRLIADGPCARPPSRLPVLLWAGLGAVLTVVALVGWGRWITSDHFKPIGVGPDGISTGKLLFLRCVEFGLAAVTVTLVWRYLARPLVRERTLRLEGMMIIGFLIAWFYDPLPNMTVWTFSYNHAFLNMGTWTPYLPFWDGPVTLHTPEPIVLMGGAYMGWYFFGPVLVGTRVINALLGRMPTLSTFGAFVILFALIFIVEVVFVFIATGAEILQFTATMESWTLAAGKPYQNPLYDPLLCSLLFTGYAAFHYFRDDQGHTFVERGVDQLRVPAWARKGLSQLAVTGFLAGSLIAVYLIPYQIFAVKSEPREDVKSYLSIEAPAARY